MFSFSQNHTQCPGQTSHFLRNLLKTGFLQQLCFRAHFYILHITPSKKPCSYSLANDHSQSKTSQSQCPCYGDMLVNTTTGKHHTLLPNPWCARSISPVETDLLQRGSDLNGRTVVAGWSPPGDLYRGDGVALLPVGHFGGLGIEHLVLQRGQLAL